MRSLSLLASLWLTVVGTHVAVADSRRDSAVSGHPTAAERAFIQVVENSGAGELLPGDDTVVSDLMGQLLTIARNDWNGPGFEVAMVLVKPLLVLQCREFNIAPPDLSRAFAVMPRGQVLNLTCDSAWVRDGERSRNFYFDRAHNWWTLTRFDWMDPWNWAAAQYRVDASLR